ncbi:ABC transporter permease subunit [Microbacterium pumilum]
MRSERIKLLSLRSTRWALLLSVLITLTMSALMSVGLAFAPPEEGMDVDALILATYGERPALGAMGQAFLTAQILTAVLGTLIVSTDRSSGTLRTAVTAVPRRTLIVAAKLITSATAAIAVAVVIGVATYAIATPAFAATADPAPFFIPETIATLLGGSFGIAVTALLSSALAFFFRSTAAALGVVLVTLFILPSIIQLVPIVGSPIASLLPPSFINGLVVSALGSDWPRMAISFGGAAAWAAVASLAANWRFRRTDI